MKKLYFINYDFYPKGIYEVGGKDKENKTEYFEESERQLWIDRYKTVKNQIDTIGLNHKNLVSGFIPNILEFKVHNMKEVIDGI